MDPENYDIEWTSECCPICTGAGAWIGVMGTILWLRCIQCGMQYQGGIATYVEREDEMEESDG